MNKKQKAAQITSLLYAHYPDTECGLQAGEDPFRLLIMAILSAQCTDARVNLVSPPLFARFPTPQSVIEGTQEELEVLIHSVGLYHAKATNIRKCCRTLCEDFGGKVPERMEDLLSLGGVGRKVANLIRGDVFGLGGIVADTHCIRISNHLGLASSDNPVQVEKQLTPLIPNDLQSGFCHRLVVFGREICTARSPHCAECFLATLCPDCTDIQK